MDRNVELDRETPKWSETRWSGCWNPEQGVGLYLHAGRCRHDLDLWWAQTVAYLPDGKLVVDRSWGRPPDPEAVRTGCFELAQRQQGAWSSSFDGAGELTTSEALSAAPRGAGAPTVPVSWEVDAEPVAPVWDMYEGASERQGFAGDTHLQQAYGTTGALTVDGASYALGGVGYKDHSSGVRAWDDYSAHRFAVVHMPGWVAHCVLIFTADGQPRGPMGAFYRGDEGAGIEVFELPPISDALGGPNECEMTLKPTGGEQVTLSVEVLHQLPITITDQGDNVNGIDWECDDEPVVVVMEGAARFTSADGEVGYGFFERGIRREGIERPLPAHAAEVASPS